MRLFFRYAVLILGLTLMTWINSPKWFGVQFPREPSPRFDSQVRKIYLNAINENQPELVLLGDSTLGQGVDPELLSQLTDKQVLALRIDGSASAMWYLVIKNNILNAEFKPRVLMIIMRDTILTAPGYRVQGVYLTRLDEFAPRHEALLVERAFVNLMNPLEFAAEKYLPLYGVRVDLRKAIDGFIRYSLASRVECDIDCTDSAMFVTFGPADLEPGRLQNAVAVAEEYLYTPRQLDFHAQVDRSFLPEIIRLTKDNDIQLIVVRLKTYSGMGDLESPALKRYILDLGAYLTENDVPFLDFGTDPRLKKEYFSDSIHLDEAGRGLFTRLLAEALGEILR